MAASGLVTKTASEKGNYLLPLASMGPLNFGLALLHGHPSEGWLQMFYQLGHLNLAAMDMK